MFIINPLRTCFEESVGFIIADLMTTAKLITTGVACKLEGRLGGSKVGEQRINFFMTASTFTLTIS